MSAGAASRGPRPLLLLPHARRHPGTHPAATCFLICIQGCQFSDFSLISDFLRIRETSIKLIEYGQNMDKVLKVTKDRLDSGKRLGNPSLNTVLKH